MGGPGGNHCRQILIAASFGTDQNHVSYFEVRELRSLPVFAVLGLVGQLHCGARAIHPRQLQRTILNGGDFSHQAAAAPLLWVLVLACPLRRSRLLRGGRCGCQQKPQNPQEQGRLVPNSAKPLFCTHACVLLGRTSSSRKTYPPGEK